MNCWCAECVEYMQFSVALVDYLIITLVALNRII